MILVKLHHLTANIPFKSCSLRFLIKGINGSQQNNLQPQVPLLPKIISKDLEETIKIKPQFLTSKKGDIMLCAVAISNEKQVVNIGYTIIDPYQSSQQRRAQLLGLTDQTGYIIYSVVHQFQKKKQREKQREKQQSSELKVQISDISELSISQQHQIPPQKQVKNRLVNTLNIKLTSNFQNNKRVEPLQPKILKNNEIYQQSAYQELQKKVIELEQQNKRFKQQTNVKLDNYQLTIELLRAQIVNQQYHMILKDNTIFQLKNEKKIRKLVGQDYKY